MFMDLFYLIISEFKYLEIKFYTLKYLEENLSSSLMYSVIIFWNSVLKYFVVL